MESIQVKKESGSEYSCPLIKLKVQGREVILLGTAHVSVESIEDVKRAVSEFKPNSICVELCKPRYDALLDPDRWKKLNVTKVIREKKMGLLFASLILASFQKKLGLKQGISPGQEMLTAVHLARDTKAELVLADRPVSTTLTRAWRTVGFFSKYTIISQLFGSLLVREKISEEEIEKLKTEDAMADLFRALPPRYKSIKDVFIKERDLYLAEKIKNACEVSKPGDTILAVLGAGHLPGVSQALTDAVTTDLKKLDEIPPGSPIKTAIIWIILSSAIGFVLYRLSGKSEEVWKQALIAWIIGRSAGAGLGAILALAHPLTIFVTMLVAPVSVFIPGSRLWMFSSLSEAFVRKPRVGDFESIAEVSDKMSDLFKAFYSNRVLHLFWTIFMVSMGLTIGNVYILGLVAKLVK